MKLRRLFGVLLIIAAVTGFLFSLAGLFAVWYYRPAVIKTVEDTLTLFDSTIKTTQDGLTIMGQLVLTTNADVNSLKTTTQTMAQTIHDTNPMLDSLTTLTGKDLLSTVDATQVSLASAQSSALIIDNALATLTRIPFLPVTPYNPEVSLHAALANVSTSLKSLTPALTTITSSLVDGKANLGAVEDNLNAISVTTNGISTALASVQGVIDRYQNATAQIGVQVETAQTAAPVWITTAAVILSLGLIWSLAAQVGLCLQGVDLMRGRGVTKKKYWKLKHERGVL